MGCLLDLELAGIIVSVACRSTGPVPWRRVSWTIEACLCVVDMHGVSAWGLGGVTLGHVCVVCIDGR